jgi:hypothetical protein
VLPAKIWCVTEKTNMRATVNYEVRTIADRLEVLACNDFKCVNQ